MANPNTYHESSELDDRSSGYDTLGDEVPFAAADFIGPIPEDLKDVPERVARISLRQRETMNDPANRDRGAYNIYAVSEDYQDPRVFSPKVVDKGVFKRTLDAPDFWQPERAEIQAYGIQRQFEDAVALSESMRRAERELGIPPTIYALSGISAAGKTTACKKVGFPGMLYAVKENGDRGDPIGTLATDNSKNYLWMAGGSCDQIHAESSMMMRKVNALWADYVSSVSGDCSEVRDKTFSDIEDVEEIIKDAKETGRSVSDLDIDVPFIVSAVGVMMRPKGSHEPHPGFDYLKKNYIKMKETRYVKLTRLYLDSGLDVSYSLMCYDYTSNPKERQREAARFVRDENGKPKLIPINEELYKQAIIPTILKDGEIAKTDEYESAKNGFMAEADQVGEQLLTQGFIDRYCEKFINPDDEDYAKAIQERLGAYLDDEHPRTITEILNDNAEA